MSSTQSTISMGSAHPCSSPSTSPLVRREELPLAPRMFTGEAIIAPVTSDQRGQSRDPEEWESWIYPEYIVPELQVEDDFPAPPLAPINPAALNVLLADHYVHPVDCADAERGMRVDEVFPSDGLVDDSLFVPAEPLLSTDSAVSEVAPSVVAARVPLLEVNLNLGEPDVPTCSKLEHPPPIMRDIPEILLSHEAESSLPRQAAPLHLPLILLSLSLDFSTTTGVVRGPKSTRAARHGGGVSAQQRRSSRVAAKTSTATAMDVPPIQHKHVCTHEGCDRSFPGAYEFGRHQRTHLPPSLFCGVCKRGVKGDRPDALRRHQRETERCKTLQRRLTDERLLELGCITREERRMSLAPEDWLD